MFLRTRARWVRTGVEVSVISLQLNFQPAVTCSLVCTLSRARRKGNEPHLYVWSETAHIHREERQLTFHPFFFCTGFFPTWISWPVPFWRSVSCCAGRRDVEALQGRRRNGLSV